jgi:serine/threonine protein kinase
LKIVDFGSSFKYSKFNVSPATTEYQAPEFMQLIGKVQTSKQLEDLKKTCTPACFDVWALGIILLEIITGTPIYLSKKS